MRPENLIPPAPMVLALVILGGLVLIVASSPVFV